jgi:thiol-disulfide isomerase/thioredoxin
MTSALYNGTLVLELNPAQFSTLVLLQPPTMLVMEFFMSWCGHCQAFAPEYASAAATLRRNGWSTGSITVEEAGFVELAAMDCVNWGSTTCANWQVWSVPNIRLLSPWANNATSALAVLEHSSASTLLAALYPMLMDACAHAAASPSWNFACATLNASTASTWFDERVRNASSTGSLPPAAPLPPSPPPAAAPRVACDARPAPVEDLRASEGDLVSSVRFAFEHEVWRGSLPTTTLDPSVQAAFIALLRVLSRGLPTWGAFYGRLEGLVTSAVTSGGDGGGALTRNAWDSAMSRAAPLAPLGAAQTSWSPFCAGALRQYTCGLWATFHTLVLRAPSDAEALAVIDAMVGFVTSIFECADCRMHFLNMSRGGVAGLGPSAALTTREGAVRWLWSAHNTVNCRLGHGAFPSVASCPQCRTAVRPSGGSAVPAVTGADPSTWWRMDAVVASLRMTFNVTATGPTTARTPIPAPRVCCMAMTPSCLACAAGLTVDEWCARQRDGSQQQEGSVGTWPEGCASDAKPSGQVPAAGSSAARSDLTAALSTLGCLFLLAIVMSIAPRLRRRGQRREVLARQGAQLMPTQAA